MTNNPQRGCGTLKVGGYYLQGGPVGDNGTFFTGAFLLGPQIAAVPPTLWFSAPPRTAVQIDPALSLTRNEVIADTIAPALRVATPPTALNLVVLGSTALIDHVGSKHYPTPASFAEELLRLGPSRRVSHAHGRMLAAHFRTGGGPLPIFFVHSALPCFASVAERRARIAEWDCDGTTDPAAWEPTWHDPLWTLDILSVPKGHNGAAHPMVRVLAFLHKRRDVRPTTQPGVFIASTIQGVVKVCAASADEVSRDDREAGIVPLVLDHPSHGAMA